MLMKIKFSNQITEIINSSPGDKELRNFGITFGIINILLFGLLFPYLFQYGYPKWPFLVSSLLFLFSFVWPRQLDFFYRSWLIIGNILSWINTRIILGFIFIVLFLPTGFLIRIFGKDLLNKQFRNKQETYRLPSRVRDIKHFEKPY